MSYFRLSLEDLDILIRARNEGFITHKEAKTLARTYLPVPNCDDPQSVLSAEPETSFFSDAHSPSGQTP